MNDWLTDSKRRSVWGQASPIQTIRSQFVNEFIHFKNTTVSISGKTMVNAHNNTRVELKRSGESGR